MKVNIYEADLFFNFISVDDAGEPDLIFGPEDEAYEEISEEMFEEYKQALEKFKTISRKLGEIKDKK